VNDRTEGVLAVIASLFVLFSAMLDPRISAGLSIVFLLGFAVYKLVGRRAE
jgi:hypothetical protein